jgi:hypothetical protein
MAPPEIPPGGRWFLRKELHKCDICQKGLMADRNIVWYTVEIAQVLPHIQALRDTHAMEVMTGSPIIAAVFSPDNIGVVMPPTKRLVCGTCMIKDVLLASLWSED